MIWKQSIFFLQILLLLTEVYGGAKEFSGQIVIDSVKLCSKKPNPYNAEIKYNEELKYATGSADIKKDLDSGVKLKVLVTKPGSVIPVFVAENSICKMANLLAPKAWANIAKSTKPKLPTPCATIKAGKYKTDKVHFVAKEFKVPSSFNGKYSVTATMKSPSEELFCMTAEVHISK